MKKVQLINILTISIIFLCLWSCEKECDTCQTEELTVPKEGLFFYYKANGDLKDNSINKYDLFGNDSLFTQDRFGQSLRAFEFNGSNGYILENQSLINQSEAQSISLWFKTDSDNSVEYGGLLAGLVGSGTAGSGSRFIISMKDGIIKCSYGDEFGPDNKWGESIYSDSVYNDNNWHHLVFVSNGDENLGFLCIDGKIIAATLWTKTNNEKIIDIDIKIGGDKIENYFRGSIDDIILYDRALSIEEIHILNKVED